MLPYFVQFHPICIKFITEDFHRNVLSDREFRECRCNESYTLLKGADEFFVLTTHACPI